MMRREVFAIYAILLISIAASNALSQEDYTDWMMQDKLNESVQEPAVCGDGLCEGIEKGVCLQDCGSTSEQQGRTASKKTVITQDVYGIVMVALAPAAFIGFIVLVLYVLSRARKRHAQEERERMDDEQAVLDARDYISRGYREEDVLKFLMGKGFTREEAGRIIWDAKKELLS